MKQETLRKRVEVSVLDVVQQKVAHWSAVSVAVKKSFRNSVVRSMCQAEDDTRKKRTKIYAHVCRKTLLETFPLSEMRFSCLYNLLSNKKYF